MRASVTLEKVCKSFGRVEAVHEVSFALNPGELVALVGHNGAGKTTLMKLMLGLIRASAGKIRVFDEDPAAGAFSAKRYLGYLPESVAFNDAVNGRETLSFYARLKGESVDTSLELLDRVGLTKVAIRRVATYSKGMRQRLGLAQALLGNPRVLLLDEPTTGLDPEFRQTFYATMRDLRGIGATVLLSSHALSELEERADRVIVMNEGSVVASGTLSELRRMATLPSRIIITMEEGVPSERLAQQFTPMLPVQQINGHVVELICTEQDKMAVIRQATAEGAGVANIEFVPPSLDELYAYFLRNQGQPR